MKITSPAQDTSIYINEEVIFQGTCESNIVRVELIADDRWPLPLPEVHNDKWSTKYSFNKSGSRKITANGFDSSNNLVSTNTINIRLLERDNIRTRIAKAEKDYEGSSTVEGPEGGTQACLWAVNRILRNAGLAPLGANPNWVPDAVIDLDQGRGRKISQGEAQPGDIVIAAGDNYVSGQRHIGICLNSGCTQVCSNSSSRAKFIWYSDFEFDGFFSNYGNSTVYEVVSNEIFLLGLSELDSVEVNTDEASVLQTFLQEGSSISLNIKNIVIAENYALAAWLEGDTAGQVIGRKINGKWQQIGKGGGSIDEYTLHNMYDVPLEIADKLVINYNSSNRARN